MFPQVGYYVTYLDNLQSILRVGLGAGKSKLKKSVGKSDGVYLFQDLSMACDVAYDIGLDCEKDWVLLRVPVKEENRLLPDEDYEDDGGGWRESLRVGKTFAYCGVISANDVFVVEKAIWRNDFDGHDCFSHLKGKKQ